MSISGIEVQITGYDGNANSIMGRVRRALIKGGRRDLVDEYLKESKEGDYDHLLRTAMKYTDAY